MVPVADRQPKIYRVTQTAEQTAGALAWLAENVTPHDLRLLRLNADEPAATEQPG